MDGRSRIDGLRIGDWLSGKLNWLPDFVGYGQDDLVPFFYVDTTGGYFLILNFVLTALTFFLVVRHTMSSHGKSKQIGSSVRKQLAIVPILLMTAYTLLIAFGRTEPRGIHTLGNNLYYAYTSHFFTRRLHTGISARKPSKPRGFALREKAFIDAHIGHVICVERR